MACRSGDIESATYCLDAKVDVTHCYREEINSTGVTIALKYGNILVAELILRYALEREPENLPQVLKPHDTELWIHSLIRLGAMDLLFAVIVYGDPKLKLLLLLRAFHASIAHGKIPWAQRFMRYLTHLTKGAHLSLGETVAVSTTGKKTTSPHTPHPPDNKPEDPINFTEATETKGRPTTDSNRNCQASTTTEPHKKIEQVTELLRRRYRILSSPSENPAEQDTIEKDLEMFSKHYSDCAHCVPYVERELEVSPRDLKNLAAELADVPISLIELIGHHTTPSLKERIIGIPLHNFPNCVDSKLRGPLHWLAMSGVSKPILHNLLRSLPSTILQRDQRDCWKRTPAHYAAMGGHDHVISVFMEYYPSWATSRDADGNTPLTTACQYGHIQCIRPLLKNSHVFGSERAQSSCLEAATLRGHYNVVEQLCTVLLGSKPLKITILSKALLAATKAGFERIALLLLSKLQLLSGKRELLQQFDSTERAALLHDATLWGLTRVLEQIITKTTQEHVSFRDDMGYTLVHHACIHQRVETLELLLSRKCPYNVGDRNGDTPLHWSCYSGSVECVKVLIQAGANVHALNRDNGTPLHSAANCGSVEISMRLLEAGSAVDAVMDDGGYPIHNCAYEDNAEFAALLLRHGASREVSNLENRTPLHDAASTGSYRALRALLSHGLCVLSAAERKLIRRTLLASMAKTIGDYTEDEWISVCDSISQNINSLKAEILRDSSLRETIALSPELLYKPVRDACSRNSEPTRVSENLLQIDENRIQKLTRALLQIDRILVVHPINVREVDESSSTDDIDDLWLSYRIASTNRYAYICQQDRGGDTALHWSLSSNSSKCAKLLLEHDADVNIRNLDGGQPIHAAVINHSAQCLPLLLQAGADPNVLFDQPGQGIDQNDIPARYGDSPLHIACRDKDIPCVALLLRGGANPSIVDARGQTALHVACESRHLGIIELLIQQHVDLSVVDHANVTAFEVYIGIEGKRLIEHVEEHLPIASSSGFEGIAKYLNDPSFVDLELSSPDGTAFPVHRVILASRCQPFEAMLKCGLQESSKDIVKVSMKGAVLHLFLAYIYTNDLPSTTGFSFETLLSLLEFADRYGVSDLITLCVRRLSAKINVETVLPIYRIACLYGIQPLQLLCIAKFITPGTQVELRKKLSSTTKKVVQGKLATDHLDALDIEFTSPEIRTPTESVSTISSAVSGQSIGSPPLGYRSSPGGFGRSHVCADDSGTFVTPVVLHYSIALAKPNTSFRQIMQLFAPLIFDLLSKDWSPFSQRGSTEN
eukprot:gb/GECG01012052.1/.p1 GENE.gb/GECG01012052.1/~~gb/GECG01012052.1/.p1  ORF type:complete len:1283 (+),score=105.94 gb/GECG01012052.1/:1-3849(+)